MDLTNEFRVSVPVEDAWNVLTDVERIAPCLPGAQLQEIEGEEYRGVVKVKVGPITAQYKGKATFKSKDDVGHVAVLKAEGRDTRGQGNASALITATLTPDGDGTVVVVETHLTITGKVAQFGRGVLVDVSGKLLTQFVECLEHDLLSSSSVAAAPSAAKPAAMTPPRKAEAPVEKAAPEPIAASAAPAAKPTIEQSAKPAEKPSAKPAAAAKPQVEPKAAPAPSVAASATPPHGDKVVAGAPAGVAMNGGPSKPVPETETETATPAHGDAVTAPAEPPTVRKIDHQAAEPVDLLDAAGVPVAKRAIPVVAGVLVILWFLRRRRNRRR